MLIIARRQIAQGFNDAKFIFAVVLVLIAFIMNGLIYSDKIAESQADWQRQVAETKRGLDESSSNLQELSDFDQVMTKPYSVLSFIADDGAVPMPNSLVVDAFTIQQIERSNTINKRMPFLPAFDWAFIVTYLMTLLCILISYDTICGEKASGTLRQVLSQPISRLDVFLGKYLGLTVTITIIMVLGSLLSIMVLTFMTVIPWSAQLLFAILWAELLSIIMLSLFVLIGMLVSSLVTSNRISLIVLMVTWVVIVILLPGVASLIGEQMVSVPSKVEARTELLSQIRELQQNAPDGSLRWNGDPFAEWMPLRKAYYQKECELSQRATRELINLKMMQMRSINTMTWISPIGLYKTFLQDTCNTGLKGFETLLEYAVNYTNQLELFVRQQDAADKESPHLVYHTGSRVEPGTFSTKPVESKIVPRWQGSWAHGGVPHDESFSLLQLLILIMANIQMAILAFWAFHRYDPR